MENMNKMYEPLFGSIQEVTKQILGNEPEDLEEVFKQVRHDKLVEKTSVAVDLMAMMSSTLDIKLDVTTANNIPDNHLHKMFVLFCDLCRRGYSKAVCTDIHQNGFDNSHLYSESKDWDVNINWDNDQSREIIFTAELRAIFGEDGPLITSDAYLFNELFLFTKMMYGTYEAAPLNMAIMISGQKVFLRCVKTIINDYLTVSDEDKQKLIDKLFGEK